jgi:CBS domain-containing protein
MSCRHGRGRKAADGIGGAPDDPIIIDRDAVFQKRQAILRILTGHVDILFDDGMYVKHLMSRKISTIEPRADVQQVRDRMQNERIRHLLVCEKNGRLIGVISDRDLHNVQAKTAEDMMTANPITVEPNSLVSPAVTLLINRRISCLPVVDGEQLVGLLTTTDLLMALQCALQALHKVAAEIADVRAHVKSQSIQPELNHPVAAS